jgi:thiamine biosynthesis lipoprotein
MGTLNVLLLDSDDDRLAQDLAQEAFAELERLEQLLSKFLPESELSLVNTLGADQEVFVGEELADVLSTSQRAWQLSGGAFDPTVGPLLEAWGLVSGEGRVPSPSETTALLDRVGMQHVLVDRDRRAVRLGRRGVALDLGGIGKGYAAGRIVARLRSRGVNTGAFLSGRSSVVVWGAPRDESGWRLEIVDPQDPGRGLCRLRVEPGAVSSSGGYERFVRAGGRVWGHVIDPRTGRPVDQVLSVLSATVWTEDAVLGDVLSTALFVLGSEALQAGGAVEKLSRGWAPERGPARVSVLLVERDPAKWGGRRVETVHFGSPGFSAVED